MKTRGEPDAGNLPVRFDGGAVVTRVALCDHRITRQRIAASALLLPGPGGSDFVVAPEKNLSSRGPSQSDVREYARI